MSKYFTYPARITKFLSKRFPSLSRREIEVCSLVAGRLSTSEVATCLSICNRTVEKHLESIFEKLEVHSREELRFKIGVQLPWDILHSARRVE
ncbi:MAG: helix-turn-helix domain-containing protein [Spirochaetia bacterium]